jgi:hypothetical protein
MNRERDEIRRRKRRDKTRVKREEVRRRIVKR